MAPNAQHPGLDIAPIAGEYRFGRAFGSAVGSLPWEGPEDVALRVGGAARRYFGRGPAVALGVFDTRPGPDWQPAAVRALRPIPSPGGVVLRWNFPRVLNASDYGGAVWQPSLPPGGQAMVLYVAGFDVLPQARLFKAPGATNVPGGNAPWPNLMPGPEYTLTSEDTDGEEAATMAGATGAASFAEQDDAVRYLVRNVGRPALDLMAYNGQVWSEADLLELAGGCRYIMAWLRFYWVRLAGTDTWRGCEPYWMPYTLSAGRAVAAAHREIHHCTYLVHPKDAVLPANLFASTSIRMAAQSPLGGAVTVVATQNGKAADGDVDLTIGVETVVGPAFLSQTTMNVPVASGQGASVITAGGHFNLLATPTAGAGNTGCALVGISVARSRS